VDAKQEARALGIAWSHVEACARELKRQAAAERQHANEVRQHAWYLHNVHTPGKWEFWRHGFVSQYGRRVDASDYTAVPGWDTLATAVALRFPEYAGVEGTERLWLFLMSAYDALPSRDDLLCRAVELLGEQLATHAAASSTTEGGQPW
jgi:hypothetical protein